MFPTFKLSTLLAVPAGIAVAIAILPAIDICAGWMFPNVLNYEEAIYWGVASWKVHESLAAFLFRLDSLIVLTIVTAILFLANAKLSDSVSIATLLIYPIEEVRFMLSCSPFQDYSFPSIWEATKFHWWCFATCFALVSLFWLATASRPRWGTPRARSAASFCLVGVLFFGCIWLR